MSGDTVEVVVSVLVGLAIAVVIVGLIFMDTEACDQAYVPPPRVPPPANSWSRVPPKVYTKADLERDARKHWDEQVRALGGVEDELFFYPPSGFLYANKIVTKYLEGGCIGYYELRHTNLQRPGFDDSVVL